VEGAEGTGCASCEKGFLLDTRKDSGTTGLCVASSACTGLSGGDGNGHCTFLGCSEIQDCIACNPDDTDQCGVCAAGLLVNKLLGSQGTSCLTVSRCGSQGGVAGKDRNGIPVCEDAGGSTGCADGQLADQRSSTVAENKGKCIDKQTCTDDPLAKEGTGADAGRCVDKECAKIKGCKSCDANAEAKCATCDDTKNYIQDKRKAADPLTCVLKEDCTKDLLAKFDDKDSPTACVAKECAKIENCATCKADEEAKCASCKDGYAIGTGDKDGTCVENECEENGHCSLCDDKKACLVCDKDYALDTRKDSTTTKGKCVLESACEGENEEVVDNDAKTGKICQDKTPAPSGCTDATLVAASCKTCAAGPEDATKMVCSECNAQDTAETPNDLFLN